MSDEQLMYIQASDDSTNVWWSRLDKSCRFPQIPHQLSHFSVSVYSTGVSRSKTMVYSELCHCQSFVRLFPTQLAQEYVERLLCVIRRRESRDAYGTTTGEPPA